MQIPNHAVGSRDPQAALTGEFFSKFSPEALKDLASMAHPSSYPANLVLATENETAPGVIIILSGEVRLSMNSADGRRLTLRIARPGEVLGLVSALSGNPCEMTAETLYPCKIARIERREFLAFLTRHPETYKTVTEELSRQYSIACTQLRTVGLSASAPEKLARLLLDMSRNGQVTESGTRFRFSFTHEEIGEFIGTSRETVTRTLNTFKHRQLVSLRGSTLSIPSRAALESYAHC
ncbi:MAG: Crp/Fnr family transcriptional regulator [Terracidiphilus sp.]|jgi:CRP/FNR family transcriptional regulator